jgi:hypothetical protein
MVILFLLLSTVFFWHNYFVNLNKATIVTSSERIIEPAVSEAKSFKENEQLGSTSLVQEQILLLLPKIKLLTNKKQEQVRDQHGILERLSNVISIKKGVGTQISTSQLCLILELKLQILSITTQEEPFQILLNDIIGFVDTYFVEDEHRANLSSMLQELR